MNEEKLYTIQELWDQGCGKPINVGHPDWPHDSYVHIIGISPKLVAIGWRMRNGIAFETFANQAHWRLYIPPKKKVVLYPALLRTVVGNYCISDHLYESEHDAVHAWINNPTLFVKLLTDRGIEIEEDDKKD